MRGCALVLQKKLRAIMSHTIHGVATSNPMWVFEVNYRLLMKLLPRLDHCADELWLGCGQGERDLSVKVTERCKYTTMLSLGMPFSAKGCWLPDLRISLRVYHDARVVEVSGYQGCHRIPPPYAVKAGSIYCKDEKRQINYLLHDLLRYCLRRGYQESSSLSAMV
jgi:uncharacterized protein YqiB (DUF1249 family)